MRARAALAFVYALFTAKPQMHALPPPGAAIAAEEESDLSPASRFRIAAALGRFIRARRGLA